MKLTGKALVIGGGIGGMCAAIELRKRGIEVDLVEVNPDWSVYGAGITISGPTLRALRTIGVVDEVIGRGGTWELIDFRSADGQPLNTVTIPPSVGAEDLPRSGGIMRPVLAQILSEATLEAGTQVRTGVTFSSIEQDADGALVRFTDGSQARYSLVIGADGVNSQVRTRLFPDAPVPMFSGQGSWRAVVPRPSPHSLMYLGATSKVGLNPVSPDEAYLYCLDHRAGADFIPEAEWPRMLVDLLAEFGGDVGQVREGFRSGQLDSARILYRPLMGFMMPAPWHSGCVMLLGDACHATTPHMASGAGIAIEDAVVLAEELQRNDTLQEALMAHTARRFERCRLVVENSLQLGEIEQKRGSKETHAELMRSTLFALAGPI